LTLRAAEGLSASTQKITEYFLTPTGFVIYYIDSITPPRTSEVELGADVSLLGARLTYTMSRQRTKDFVALVPYPSSLGYSGAWANAMDLTGTTHEATLFAPIVRRGPLGWDVVLSAHRSRAKVDQLRTPETFYGIYGTGLLYLVKSGATL